MKKILTLLMVLGMVSAANATVIDLVMDPTNEGTTTTHAGTESDRMGIGEFMAIKMVLNDNDYVESKFGAPGAPYDGYILSLLDVSITVSSNGQILERGGLFGGSPDFHSDMSGDFIGFEKTGDNFIDQAAGISLNGVSGAGGPIDLLWDLKIEALAGGKITICLGLNTGPGGESKNQYAMFHPDAAVPLGEDFQWLGMALSDFGQPLDIWVVPEPMTIALLGLGGLGLLYRRRRA